MRKFVTSFDRTEVDLDDPKTYEFYSSDPIALENEMFSEIGYALCYMNNFYPEIYKGKRDGGQKKRVMKLIKEFCDERKDHYTDVLWLQEKLYIFQDEIENMC